MDFKGTAKQGRGSLMRTVALEKADNKAGVGEECFMLHCSHGQEDLPPIANASERGLKGMKGKKDGEGNTWVGR